MRTRRFRKSIRTSASALLLASHQLTFTKLEESVHQSTSKTHNPHRPRNFSPSLRPSIPSPPFLPPQMCNILFAQPACPCPAYPCHPYYQLCEQADRTWPGRACSRRRIRVGWTGLACGVCRSERWNLVQRGRVEGKRRWLVGQWERGRAAGAGAGAGGRGRGI
jgi:hypothetical protein